MDYCKDLAFQDAKRDEALLTVVKPIILQGDGMPVEEALDTLEIEAVFPKVLCPFGLIPSHPHLESVATPRNYVKRKLSGIGLAMSRGA